ncbi:HAD hydrolase-like protein, partial [Candidatus Magnetaquicoccus inordinatus]|uniref:HAD hydrolase-like protein n=1 Tax=Candidatus Magnetaquicoccus inordinatus TaxID=2496818 RepID=UPI0012922A98
RQECLCRKPQPGMLEQAIAEWEIDRERSLLLGDRHTDLQAAQRAGIKGYLYQGGSLKQQLWQCLAALEQNEPLGRGGEIPSL